MGPKKGQETSYQREFKYRKPAMPSQAELNWHENYRVGVAKSP